VAEKVRDLLTKNGRQILIRGHVGVERMQRVDRDRDDLFIRTNLIFHQQRANGLLTPLRL